MSSISSVTSSIINNVKPKFNIDFSKITAEINSLTADTFEKTSNDAIFSKNTFEKAKEMVIETILGNNPKESLVLINDDKIIYHTIGEAHSVGGGDKKLINLLNDPKNRIAVVHSHPTIFKDGSSRPVSYGDFGNLNCHQGERSIYAINSLGEYSSLKKQGNTRPSIFKVIDYQEKFENELINSLSGEEREFFEKHWKFSDNSVILPQKDIEQLEKEYWEFSNKESVARATSEAAHNFWLKYADKLGVKYDTNYSCFT